MRGVAGVVLVLLLAGLPCPSVWAAGDAAEPGPGVPVVAGAETTAPATKDYVNAAFPSNAVMAYNINRYTGWPEGSLVFIGKVHNRETTEYAVSFYLSSDPMKARQQLILSRTDKSYWVFTLITASAAGTETLYGVMQKP